MAQVLLPQGGDGGLPKNFFTNGGSTPTSVEPSNDPSVTTLPGTGGFDWSKVFGGGEPSTNNGGGTPSWITQIFGDGSNGGIFGGGTGGGSNAIAMAGLTAALKQWNDANKYQQVSQQAAGMANPFGDRSQYIKMLSDSYKDPSAVLNDPAHQVLLHRGLDDVASNNAAKGYLGSGNMAIDLSKYASDSNATYLDQERKTLGNLAGAQFDPANAAGMLMKGNDQAITSQNGALAAIMAPFMAQLGQNNINSGGNPPKATNSAASTALNAIKGITNPSDIAHQLVGLATMTGGTVKDLISQMLADPNIDPSTAYILQSIGGDGSGGGVPADGSGGNSGIPPLNPYAPDPNGPIGPPEPGIPGFRLPVGFGPGDMPNPGDGGGYVDPGDNWDSWLQGISAN